MTSLHNPEEEREMRKSWWIRGLKFALFGVLAIGLVGAAVMLPLALTEVDPRFAH